MPIHEEGAMADVGEQRWVRACFVDLFGVLRCVEVPPARWTKARTEGLIVDGSAAEGAIRVLETDCVLRLDESARLVSCGVERVLGTLEGADGRPWPLDPRAALAQIAASANAVLPGWRGAAEIEFYVLDAHGQPVDRSSYFADVVGSPHQAVLAAADALLSSGVPVAAVHHEGGPGQWEIDLGPLGAGELADAIVLARAAVADACAAGGLAASFAARPIPHAPGSGLHVHQLVPVDEDAAGWVVGGLLEHAAGLTALAAPTVGSFRRLHAGPEAPGAVVWAHEARAALVRVGTATTGEPSVEYRGADPMANPYLVVAGLLVASGDGIARRLEPGPAMDEDPEGFDPVAARAALASLPRSLEEAIDALLDDEVLVDAFDDRLVHRLVDAERARAQRALAEGRDPEIADAIEA